MDAEDDRVLRQRRGGSGERWRDLYATPADHPPVEYPVTCPPRIPDAAASAQLRVLRLTLRAAAVAALTEAEWVRRVRATGTVLDPIRDPRGQVTRYSARMPDPRESSAGTTFLDLDLGTDLLLRELRSTWAETDGADAAIEWHGPGHRFGRESVPVVDRALWASAVADAHAFTTALAEIPAYDRDRWAWAAGRVAGLLAIWSLRTEPEPSELARASAELSASASRRGGRARPSAGPDLRRAAYLLTQVRADARDEAAERLLLRHLADATTAIADAHRARGATARARRLHTEAVLALEPRRRATGDG